MISPEGRIRQDDPNPAASRRWPMRDSCSCRACSMRCTRSGGGRRFRRRHCWRRSCGLRSTGCEASARSVSSCSTTCCSGTSWTWASTAGGCDRVCEEEGAAAGTRAVGGWWCPETRTPSVALARSTRRRSRRRYGRSDGSGPAHDAAPRRDARAMSERNQGEETSEYEAERSGTEGELHGRAQIFAEGAR